MSFSFPSFEVDSSFAYGTPLNFNEGNNFTLENQRVFPYPGQDPLSNKYSAFDSFSSDFYGGVKDPYTSFDPYGSIRSLLSSSKKSPESSMRMAGQNPEMLSTFGPQEFVSLVAPLVKTRPILPGLYT